MRSAAQFLKSVAAAMASVIVGLAAPVHGTTSDAEWDVEILKVAPDPLVVTDENGRKRMLQSGLPWKVRDRKTGIVMLLCPVGGDAWCAVGDAAIAWDPLSSQGLVTGILMGSRSGSAVAGHTELMDQIEQDYRMLLEEHLSLRRHFWNQERRWATHPFWQRRIETIDPSHKPGQTASEGFFIDPHVGGR